MMVPRWSRRRPHRRPPCPHSCFDTAWSDDAIEALTKAARGTAVIVRRQTSFRELGKFRVKRLKNLETQEMYKR